MVQILEVGLDDIEPKGEKVARRVRPKVRVNRHTKSNSSNLLELNIQDDLLFGEGAPKQEQKEPGDDKDNDIKLVIAIDFGTTYSGELFEIILPQPIVNGAKGAAWASSDDLPGEIEVIKQWPGTEDTREKAPTTISIENASHGDSDAWGYEITPQVRSSSWFKLKMAERELVMPQDDPLLKQAVGKGLLNIPEGSKAEDLCLRYLKLLHDHVMRSAEKNWGTALLSVTPIRYVLTVPADWGNVYKDNLKRAAYDAGVAGKPRDTISIMSEPEAAARAAFQSPKRGLSKFVFQEDNNVVVIDMGGGTVVSSLAVKSSTRNASMTSDLGKDLITYRILKTNPFRVREACAGTSGKCGATTIDRALHELMTKKYGSAFFEKGPEEISHGSQFMKEFESIKRTFNAAKPEYKISLLMEVDDATGYEADEGKVILTRDEISEMFSQVVAPSIELLNQQISKSKEDNNIDVQVVVLCGGLSGCQFIQEKIRTYCQSKGIEMIVPDGSWSAIARGAVCYGLAPKSLLDSRKCRCSYGMSVHRKYDPSKDSDNKNILNCPIYGKRVRGCMKWHIKREETIRRNKPARIDAYVNVNKSREPINDIQLYKCNSADPPESVTSEGVEKFCLLRIDLSKIRDKPGSKFKRHKRSQKAAVHIRVEQQVYPERDEVEFVAKVGRTRVGCKTERYEAIEEMDED